MLFILKKKKEKRKRKMLVTKEEKKKKKSQLTNPFCTKLERRRSATGRLWKQGAPVF